MCVCVYIYVYIYCMYVLYIFIHLYIYNVQSVWLKGIYSNDDIGNEMKESSSKDAKRVSAVPVTQPQSSAL